MFGQPVYTQFALLNIFRHLGDQELTFAYLKNPKQKFGPIKQREIHEKQL